MYRPRIIYAIGNSSMKWKIATLHTNLKRFSTCLRSPACKILINKEDPLVDEELKMNVEGLKPGQRITLRATSTMQGRNKTTFQSFAHYKADSTGLVDLTKHQSLGGTYNGTEPMGLLWSMVPLKNEGITKMRIIQRDVTTPFESRIEVYDNFIDFGAETYSDISSLCKTLSPLDTKIINRWYFAKDKVIRETVKDGRIRGELYMPKGAGKFRGVIDLFGSGGGLMSFRAALLASHGFAVYSLPYFGYDDLPHDTSSLEIEYFEEAAQWLMKHPKVYNDGIGIIATSLGVQYALMLAIREKNKIKATIGINGPDGVIMSPIYVDGQQTGFTAFSMEKLESLENGSFLSRSCLLEEFEDGDERICQLEIEKMEGKLLYLASGDDKSYASELIARRMQNRMARYGKSDKIRVVQYSKAGHLLEPPYAPNCSSSFHSIFGIVLEWGGNDSKAHIDAEVNAWKEILRFFNESLS